ncbi:hypothetical protein F5Y09DRAFT_340014 [Xylaria sp. FL1042]|nr:hypothetical protein F5Y09DRAFT_340014 [Xylaria sp. FL1042]
MQHSTAQSMKGAVSTLNPEQLLQYLYADLRRLSEVVSPDIVLHPFDTRHTSLHGVAEVQAHENALVAATDGTLRMDVESMAVSGNYAVVAGTIRARKTGLADLEAGFCGLWRFEDGIPVEHWEEVTGDAQRVSRWFLDANWERPYLVLG